MLTAPISRPVVTRPCFIMLSLLCLMLLIMPSACTSGTSATNTVSKTVTSTAVAASAIQVGAQPDIIVKGEGALRLTFVGSDTQSISTATLSLPYTKNGNQVTIDLGKTLNQDLEIQVPRAANLNVTLTGGNVVVDSLQGQVAVALTSGTIHVEKFTPSGTNTIQTKNGTIDVTFTNNTSCSLKAQTDFGAIVSGYSTISEKRDAMKSAASGAIGAGSGATVNLIAGYGSISLGPA